MSQWILAIYLFGDFSAPRYKKRQNFLHARARCQLVHIESKSQRDKRIQSVLMNLVFCCRCCCCDQRHFQCYLKWPNRCLLFILLFVSAERQTANKNKNIPLSADDSSFQLSSFHKMSPICVAWFFFCSFTKWNKISLSILRMAK